MFVLVIVAAEGPEACDHNTAATLPSGSLAEPDTCIELMGNVVDLSGPAETTGGWFCGSAITKI